MCATGYCSAQRATNVCLSLAPQTIAAPRSAALITATTMASVHTIQAKFQFAGKNIHIHTHTHRHTCLQTSYVSPCPSMTFLCMWASFCLCISCLVGEDFWYMGQRCDMRMTRARLVAACLAILLVMLTVIGVLAFVAVRRYRAILIQAKVDQTRSRYTLNTHNAH